MNKVAWQVEYLRASLFFSPPIWSPVQLFQDTLGFAPTDSQLMGSSEWIQESASNEGGLWAIVQRRERIDVQLSIAPPIPVILNPGGPLPSAPPQASFARIGPYSDFADTFNKRVLAVIERISKPISRIAYNAATLLETDSERSAVEAATPYLHSISLGSQNPSPSDIVWRANRKRDSKTVQGLRLNRISTWTIIQAQELQITIVGGGTPIITPKPSATKFAARVELDINSDIAWPTPFEPKQTQACYGELVVLAEEILDKGDVS